MMTSDPTQCRRALQEIGEVAAVAILDGSPMSAQDALQIIAAIAEWADEIDVERANCSEVVQQIHRLTSTSAVAELSDRAASALFSEVLSALRTSETAHPRMPS